MAGTMLSLRIGLIRIDNLLSEDDRQCTLAVSFSSRLVKREPAPWLPEHAALRTRL
jgi:hypothetical protein